jgi:hypothetical protein
MKTQLLNLNRPNGGVVTICNMNYRRHRKGSRNGRLLTNPHQIQGLQMLVSRSFSNANLVLGRHFGRPQSHYKIISRNETNWFNLHANGAIVQVSKEESLSRDGTYVGTSRGIRGQGDDFSVPGYMYRYVREVL